MQSASELAQGGPTDRALRRPERASGFPGRFRRTVAIGEKVYQPGDERRLYRVESGAVCHYALSSDDRRNVLEFSFPGEIIGLGYLPTHVTVAKAMVETRVCIITEADLERELAKDSRLYFRLAEAADREFEYVRQRSQNVGSAHPVQRVANFLLAIVGINSSEGREPLFVTNDVRSGYVAEQLQMTIDTLEKALLSLRERSVVAVSSGGLRILDLVALERIADEV